VEAGMDRRSGHSGDRWSAAQAEARAVQTRAIAGSLESRGVGADQRQLKSLSRDRRDVGVVAPAQLEPIAGLFH
jgi:hypothetical protein